MEVEQYSRLHLEDQRPLTSALRMLNWCSRPVSKNCLLPKCVTNLPILDYVYYVHYVCIINYIINY